MKRIFKLTKAITMKAIALILWPVLFVFNTLAKMITWTYRFFFPFVILSMTVVILVFLDDGVSRAVFNSLGTLALLGGLYYLLPLVPPMISRTQLRAKNRALSPVAVRSPVKFTL